MVEVEPTQDKDAKELYENLQSVQFKELIASHGPDVLGTIKECISQSIEAFTIRHNGKMLAITGIVSSSPMGAVASPWLLTTNTVLVHPRILLRGTQLFIKRWSENYDCLLSFIDSRYDQALRWAKWAGFTIHPPVSYGVNGELFNPIEIRR